MTPNDNRKDFIRLCTILVLTAIFWIASMTNANAQSYYLERDCTVDVKPEQVNSHILICLDTIDKEPIDLSDRMKVMLDQLNNVDPTTAKIGDVPDID